MSNTFSSASTGLLSGCPDVAAQWHPTLNGSLSPADVKAGADRKVWWVCDEGHEYDGSVRKKVQGAGCPVCSNKRVLAGYNDLESQAPEISVFWHPTKNGGLLPSQITSKSNKKVWWVCGEGHAYDSSPANQHVRSSCPVCSGKRVLVGFNDLVTTHPEIAAQWHPTLNGSLSAADVSRGTARKVWWVCEKGHEYDGAVANRVHGAGCPVCSNRRVLAGYNDLESQAPEIVVCWHPTLNGDVLPSQVPPYGKKKVWWLCEEGHEYHRSPANQQFAEGSCPVCSGKQVLVGVNDLVTTHPVEASEWHPVKNGEWTAQEVTRGSSKKAWWLCRTCGGEWEAAVGMRCGKGHSAGCPFCAGMKVQSGLNDLETTHPEIAAQWHLTKNSPLLPSAVRRGSGLSAWWQCEKGHEWQSRVADRSAGAGCGQCYREGLHTGGVSLRESHPELVSQWDEVRNLPHTVDSTSGSSNRRVWWVCEVDGSHSWQAVVANRAMKRSGCPVCWSSRLTSVAEMDLLGVLVSLGLTVVQSDRKVLGTGQELDLYVPKKKFAVEFNGLYWHSEAAGKGRGYHVGKWAAAQAVGVQLVQVWEDDWRDKRSIVIRGLAHRLGVVDRLPVVLPDAPGFWFERVGARSLSVVELSFGECSKFLDVHHVQGGVKGSLYVGLVDSQERLRAALVLTRTGNAGEVLISRYATAGVVPGGFSRLLSYAQRVLSPARWVSFADRAVSDGGLYELTGFIAESVVRPDYAYLVGKRREHKFGYRLKRFRDDPSLLWEDGLTESELAELNGLVRVWDSGKVKFVKDVV